MVSILTLFVIPFFAVGRPAASAPPAAVDSTEIALVEVENDRNVPVTIYAEQGMRDVRLGVVAALTDSTLRVPDFMLGEGQIKFFARPAGQVEEATDYVEIERGKRVGLVVPAR